MVAAVALASLGYMGDAAPDFLRPSGVGAQVPATPGNYAARGVATDPAHPGTVYVGLQLQTGGNSGGQGIWKSTDYGASWARVDTPWNAPCGQFDGIPMSITVAPNGDVYAVNVYGCDMGVLKSTDGGVTWANKFAGDFNNVSIDPTNPNHLIAGYHSRHDICGAECDTGVAQSFDAGQTWTVSNAVTGGGWGQYAHFINSTTWLVSTQGHGLHRTTNSGATWTKVSNFSAIAYGDLLRVGSVLYTGVAEGILRSTDQGATWVNVLPETTPDVYMGLAADSTGRIYAHAAYPFGGFSGGAFKTSLDGITWTNLNAQSFSNGPNQMASDGQYVYAANWELGIWRYAFAATATPTPSVNTATPTPMVATSTSTPGVTPTSTSTPMPTATSAPQDRCYERIKVSASGAVTYINEVAC